MIGNENVQDLINVHFRTNDALSKFLMRRGRRGRRGEDDDGREEEYDDEVDRRDVGHRPEDENRAMLHFVYNHDLVGVFVCHDMPGSGCCKYRTSPRTKRSNAISTRIGYGK